MLITLTRRYSPIQFEGSYAGFSLGSVMLSSVSNLIYLATGYPDKA
jgi:hypothetical protein